MIKPRCFTLVEFLCVVAIITIISSLILPSVVKARSVAHASVCRNNLRSIGQFNLSYSHDNNGFSMPADFGNTNDGQLHHWANQLMAQSPSPDLLLCPEMSSEDTFDPAGHDPATGDIYREASYIMNIIPGSGWLGASPEEAIKLNDVTQPANTIFITDVIKQLSNSHIGINAFSRTDHGELMIPPIGDVRRVGNHHEGGFNILWGDGHVSQQYQSDPIQWEINQ